MSEGLRCLSSLSQERCEQYESMLEDGEQFLQPAVLAVL